MTEHDEEIRGLEERGKGQIRSFERYHVLMYTSYTYRKNFDVLFPFFTLVFFNMNMTVEDGEVDPFDVHFVFARKTMRRYSARHFHTILEGEGRYIAKQNERPNHTLAM